MSNIDRFKVRVWDKDTNKFLDENEFYIQSCGALAFYSYEGRGEFNSNRYIKQQCTGLKDKNGKLIYEGDILELPCYTVEQGQFIKIAEVVWKVDSFACNVPNDGSYSLEHWIVKRDINRRCLIVGNKFENPEDLEENDRR